MAKLPEIPAPIPRAAPGGRGVVLALSGGGAPGLAHIGVLQVLAENDIPVRAIVGSSIGAEIGAFYVSGMPIEELVRIATRFDWKQTLALFLPDLPTGGLVSGARIMEFLRSRLGHHAIEELPLGYAAIAADLETGEEVVLDHGDLVEAVRASVSVPGLIAPHQVDGRILVDGGVVNPVPFDVARERFGGPVIAVAVHGAVRDRSMIPPPPPRRRQWVGSARQLLDQPWMGRAPGLRDWLRAQLAALEAPPATRNAWTTRRVLDRVLNIAQAEVVRLRAERQPPDLMLLPAVNGIGFLEFYRAKEAIAAGRRAAEASLDDVRRLLAAAWGPGRLMAGLKRRLRRSSP
ncbi:MAG TPA: patatin-like phospholipase family protein [Burkholderiales bacterium]